MTNLRGYFDVEIDRQAFYLAGLFLVVQAAAAYLAYVAASGGVDPTPPGGVDGPAAGAGWAVAEIAVAGLFLGAIVAYFKIPEWLRDHIKDVSKALALILAGGWAQSSGLLIQASGVAVGGYAVAESGLWWLLNNAMSVILAVFGGLVVGLLLNEWALLVFLVGMSAYDHYFADKQEWMFQMADVLVTLRLPVLFVKPETYRFDWDDLFAENPDEASLADSKTAWGIGTADMLLPAAVGASLVSSESIAAPVAVAALVIGAVVISTFRIRHKMLSEKAGAGLPPITAAVAIAYAAVVLPATLYAGVMA